MNVLITRGWEEENAELRLNRWETSVVGDDDKFELGSIDWSHNNVYVLNSHRTEHLKVF